MKTLSAEQQEQTALPVPVCMLPRQQHDGSISPLGQEGRRGVCSGQKAQPKKTFSNSSGSYNNNTNPDNTTIKPFQLHTFKVMLGLNHNSMVHIWE